MSSTLPPSSAPPLALHRLTRNEAQARTVIAQRAHGRPVHMAGQDWLLDLVPLAGGEALVQQGEWRVRLTWAGAPFAWTAPSAALQEWVAARFPGIDVAALPDAHAAALLETAAGEVLECLAAQQRGPAQLDALDRDPGQPDGLTHHFVATAAAQGRVVRGRLSTNSLGLMMLAGLVARAPVVDGPLPLPTLPVPVRVTLGSTTLPADDCASLAVGDTVLMDQVLVSAQGQVWLGCDAWGVQAQWTEGCLTVASAFTQLGWTMSDTSPSAGGESAPVAIDKLPVRVSFDLGERTMTLADLQALQPGQTLDLGQPLSTAVQVRANGTWIGMGELVEIDGRLGVTLTTLASAPQPAP